MEVERIYISHVSADQTSCNDLITHLQQFLWKERIALWQLTPGLSRMEQIRSALPHMSAVVILLSADYLADWVVALEELPELFRTVESRAQSQVPFHVLPVLVGHCDYESALCGRVLVDKRPLRGMTTTEQEELFQRIVRGLEKFRNHGRALPIPLDVPIRAPQPSDYGERLSPLRVRLALEGRARIEPEPRAQAAPPLQPFSSEQERNVHPPARTGAGRRVLFMIAAASLIPVFWLAFQARAPTATRKGSPATSLPSQKTSAVKVYLRESKDPKQPKARIRDLSSGTVLGEVPWKGEMIRSEQKVKLQIWYPGYESQPMDLDLQQDVDRPVPVLKAIY